LKNINYNPKIYYTFFSIFIFLEIFRYFSFLKNVNFYFVQSLAYLNIFLLILLTIRNYINIKSLNYSYYNISIIIFILFFYLFLDFILGVIGSKNYGDYKFIFSNFLPWTMLILAIFEGIYFYEKITLLKKMFKYIFLLGILIIITDRDFIGFCRLYSFIYLLIIFLPFINLKGKIIIIIVSIMALTVEGWRFNVLRIYFSYILVLLYYTPFLIKKVVTVSSNILLISPIFFLFLYYNYSFDILNYFEDTDLILTSSENTRSFLFDEMINHLNRNDINIFLGAGSEAAYESDFFYNFEKNFSKGRYASESGFLSLFFKSGLIALILLNLIFILIVNFILKSTNNKFGLMISLIISFNWVSFYIEYPIVFNTSSFLFFYILGFGLNRYYISMNDLEIKQFFKQKIN
jgi:hypothetical protein